MEETILDIYGNPIDLSIEFGENDNKEEKENE